MTQTRPKLWTFLALCVAVSAVGCVDGSVPAGAADKPVIAGSTSAAGGGQNGTIADGSCHDTTSDPAHCGSCSNVCGQGQVCAQGVCQGAISACAAPQTLCSGTCVDLASPAHCGACGTACAAGQTCTAGACVCPATQIACNGACVDTQSNNDHCGACSQPCATGAACSAGQCACAQGQAICSGVCADLQQSAANCGGCGHACATGETCTAGACVTGAGADGCSGKPLGVTLSQIAVYQTVKVAVMDAGSEIPVTMRPTDVVSGRQTMFRLSATVDSGFTPRELSARITVNNGTSATQFFAKQTLSKSSVDTDATSTFQVYVPPEQVTPDTRYSAELVQCGASVGAGSAGVTRFPASADIELGARHTGGVKVEIIPLLANGNLPDTSDTALAVYRQQLIAMYPIDGVELTVGPEMSIKFPIDWEGALDQMRSRRKTDNPAADVYYFGLLKPLASFSQFCGNGCTSGIGYVADVNAPSFRAAMGIGYADRASAQTMAHELGHNHGRNHAPCVPSGGSISGVDPKYPFSDGRTGVLGYDARTKVLLSADKSTDMMGYCSNVWLSAYTYGAITDRVAAVNGNQSQVVNPAALQTWRILLLGSGGPRWGTPITRPSLAEGQPISARILDAKGNLLTQIEVYRTEVSDTGSAVAMVPEPKPGWAAIQVPGSAALAF